MKCRYGHCKHESKEIDSEDAVRIGNSYYHPDCYHEKETIDMIIDTWVNEVDPHPVFAALCKIIRNMIYNQGVNADFLLFALRRATARHRISHPPGLYYIVKDQDTINAWNRQLAEKQNKIEFTVDTDYASDTSFNYHSTKQSGFGRILT